MTTTCPTDDTLGALVERALAADELERVSAHLDGCSACRDVVVAAVRGGVATPATLALGTPSLPPLGAPAGTPIGTRIGRYEVRALLGAGGMGQVYEAYDGELDRAIALKVLRPELARNAVVLAERLLRESRLMAKVVHPAVITVHDVGRAGDAVFIAMELIRGETLASFVARTRPRWRDVVALFERAGGGLAAAHDAGIVHRDFKPDNVLVERDGGRVIVTDFGIARAAVAGRDLADAPLAGTRAEVELTGHGVAIGTPAYMAPEQLDGKPVDARADVFAFSVSLWEALFGERPFTGTTPQAIRAAMERPPRSPRGSVPRSVVRVLERGLAVAPAARWPDLRAMVRALASARARRRRVAIAAAATGLVGVGIAGALVLSRPAHVDPCAAQAAAFATVNRRDAVAAALAADPKVRDGVLGKLDAAVTAWRATHAATCQADRAPVQPAATTACLDARRLEIVAFVDDVIADGPRHALELAGTMGRPERCTTDAPGLLFAHVPADPALRRKVTALRYRAFDAEAARDRGEFEAALAVEPAIVGDAAALWPPLHAEALYLLGTTQSQGGDDQQALKTLREAAAIAESAHHDWIAANSWIQLAISALTDASDPKRALEYVTYADAVLARLGRPPDVDALFAYAKGMALIGLDRDDDGERELHRAEQLAEANAPSYVPVVIQGLAFLYEEEGRYREAAAAYRKSLAMADERSASVRLVSEEHLATDLRMLGQDDDAIAAARVAVADADRTLPAGNSDRLTAHATLAQVLEDSGKPGEALDEARMVEAGIAKSSGEHSAHYGQALMLEGDVLSELGRNREASELLAHACEIMSYEADGTTDLAQCWTTQAGVLLPLHRGAEVIAIVDKALAVLTAAHGESHPEVANALVVRGAAHADLQQRDAAIADLERAIALYPQLQVEPARPALAQWLLAKQIWTADPARARALFDAAMPVLDTPAWRKHRDEALAWRAKHP